MCLGLFKFCVPLLVGSDHGDGWWVMWILNCLPKTQPSVLKLSPSLNDLSQVANRECKKYFINMTHAEPRRYGFNMTRLDLTPRLYNIRGFCRSPALLVYSPNLITALLLISSLLYRTSLIAIIVPTGTDYSILRNESWIGLKMSGIGTGGSVIMLISGKQFLRRSAQASQFNCGTTGTLNSSYNASYYLYPFVLGQLKN